MTTNIENTENIENKIKIDSVLEELYYLRHRNEFLERQVKALKLNNAKITLERNEINDKLIRLSGELSQLKRELRPADMITHAEVFVEAQILSELHESELVSAMGSYMEDY